MFLFSGNSKSLIVFLSVISVGLFNDEHDQDHDHEH